MIIREATEQDIPQIIQVLKASLGETSSKKNEDVWRYKHVANPFGKSLVLVAEEDNKLVGVRAFMRWQWKYLEEKFSAFRAVDTATHPEYQGKGIFKKLTLKALELAKERGDHFVFNTPNEQSKPGYLKMGWKEVENIKIQVSLLNPFTILFGKKNHIPKTLFSTLNTEDSTKQKVLISNYNKKRQLIGLYTPKSRKFLTWRYEENPLQQYMVYNSSDGYVAVYLKKRGKIRELRVVEMISGNETTEKKLNKWIRSQARENRAHIITTEPNQKSPGVLNFTSGIGPVLTVKNINLDQDHSQKLMKIQNWAYSIGDLELF